jgi:hypothetical protein
MKKFLLTLFILSLLVVSTTVFAKPKARSYKCEHVGQPKIKPYHFKKIRHFGYFAISIKAKAKYKITK